MQKKTSEHMKLLCCNPYVMTNSNARIEGDRNGLSMRLKVKTSGNNWMWWANLFLHHNCTKIPALARLEAEKERFPSSVQIPKLPEKQIFQEDSVAITNISQGFPRDKKNSDLTRKSVENRCLGESISAAFVAVHFLPITLWPCIKQSQSCSLTLGAAE